MMTHNPNPTAVTDRNAQAMLEALAQAFERENAAQEAYDAAVSKAYASGKVDGKNAEIRGAQLSEIIAPQQAALNQAKSDVELARTKIALYKAWLYSTVSLP